MINFIVAIDYRTDSQQFSDCLESFTNTLQDYQVLVINNNAKIEVIKILDKFYHKIYPFMEDKSKSRNFILNQIKGYVVHIEPYETLAEGFIQETQSIFRIVQGQFISYQVRVFQSNIIYNNPIFETTGLPLEGEFIATVISKPPQFDEKDINILNQWIKNEPLNAEPYYYKACILLSLNKIDEFIPIAKHYLFLEKNIKSIQNIAWTQYYLGLTYLSQGKFEVCLQSAMICLSVNVLMAEFWCLAGNCYYYLKDYEKAKMLFENAIILGSQRKMIDEWSMDIDKYKNYPEMMIMKINML